MKQANKARKKKFYVFDLCVYVNKLITFEHHAYKSELLHINWSCIKIKIILFHRLNTIIKKNADLPASKRAWPAFTCRAAREKIGVPLPPLGKPIGLSIVFGTLCIIEFSNLSFTINHSIERLYNYGYLELKRRMSSGTML